MKVFISWSGGKSREVAVALRDWLPPVINSVELFVSSRDIDPGTRWQMEVAAELESTVYGIVCVTRQNQSNPWLNFEAGALAKVVSTGRVVPLAIDLKPSDVKVPLGQFQAQPASENGMRELVKAINAAGESPLPPEVVDKAFGKWWPDLQEKFDEIEAKSSPGPAGETLERSDRELLEETLNTVRSLARQPRLADRHAHTPVNAGHPFLDRLNSLLSEHPDCVIVHARARRRLGVRTPGRLPPVLADEIRAEAAVYGIDIDFLPTQTATGRAVAKPAIVSKEADGDDNVDPPAA